MCFRDTAYPTRVPSHRHHHGHHHHNGHNNTRYYKEEVYVAPRPVRYSQSSSISHSHSPSHHHHSHSPSHHNGRSSYTSINRTIAIPATRNSRTVIYASQPSPRHSTSSYRQSGPLVEREREVKETRETRRSTQYVR